MENSHFALLCGNDRVAGDQLREDATNSFDTKGERADIDKNDTASLFGSS